MHIKTHLRGKIKCFEIMIIDSCKKKPQELHVYVRNEINVEKERNKSCESKKHLIFIFVHIKDPWNQKLFCHIL